MKIKMVVLMLCSVVSLSFFTGCINDASKTETVREQTIEENESTVNTDLELEKENNDVQKEIGEDEMAKTFTDDEKEMMAGKNSASNETVNDSDINADDSNVAEINGFNIRIMPDKSMNEQKDGGKYSELSHVTYYSNTCEKERGMNIALPAGYSKDKKYPVLYVLHGIFGDEYSMCGDGKSGVQALIDNMTINGDAKEMIVVYPFMYASKDRDQCTAIDDENVEAYDNFVNEIADDIMPYIAENYSVLEGKENTAVTGFSMGGRESLAIGLIRPDLFGYVGAIAPAPGLVPGKDMHLDHKGQFEVDEIKYDNEKPEFIMLCSGTSDSVVGKFPVSYHELFDEKEIEHIWWEIPGSDHGDPAIRSGIENFVRYIFK